MNKKSIKNAHLALKKLAKDRVLKNKLSFKFESEFLNYKSYLKDFSLEHYKIFDELSSELGLKNSIDDLFGGKVVNKIENRAALHHQYRLNQKVPEFDFTGKLLEVVATIEKDLEELKARYLEKNYDLPNE